MNSSIKARQTRLIKWLESIGCTFKTKAESGSCYLDYCTRYTGNSEIRISDHLSGDRNYIHVILSPINTNVVVNYKNFVWTGDFSHSKSIIYTMIMSKAMSEQSIIDNNKKVLNVKQSTSNKAVKAKVEAAKSKDITITNRIYSSLTEDQKKLCKTYMCGKPGKAFTKIPIGSRKLTLEQWTNLKSTKIISESTTGEFILKSDLLKLDDSMKKEIANWLNAESIESLPCEKVPFTKNQYKIIKLYI